MTAEAGIAGEVNDLARGFDDESAPECAIAVERSARRKVQRGDAVNVRPRNCDGFAPVEFTHRTDALCAKQAGYTRGNDEAGLPALRQSPETGKVQMVIVIVAEEHDIDAGEILPSHARFAQAPRAGPGHRTCALRPDRIGQDVDAVSLKQHGGMVDQRNTKFVGGH